MEREDWTGTEYITGNKACFGGPCDPKKHASILKSLSERKDVPPNIRPNIDIEREDDTGTHWATTHRRFGKPPAQNKADEDGHIPVLWPDQKPALMQWRVTPDYGE